MAVQPTGILKKYTDKKQIKRTVTFDKYDYVFTIPNREQLFETGEIKKLRKGRFTILKIDENEKPKTSRFIVSIRRFTIS